jgi:hypothetical protein
MKDIFIQRVPHFVWYYRFSPFFIPFNSWMEYGSVLRDQSVIRPYHHGQRQEGYC